MFLGDGPVKGAVANNRRAAANVRLRPEQEVELEVNLCVRLLVPREHPLLWFELRRRNRVRVSSEKICRVGVGVNLYGGAACALQLELGSLHAAFPMFVRSEVGLDARDVVRAGGLVPEDAGAAVVVRQEGADPHALDWHA